MELLGRDGTDQASPSGPGVCVPSMSSACPQPGMPHPENRVGGRVFSYYICTYIIIAICLLPRKT